MDFNIGLSSRVMALLPPGTDGSISGADQSARWRVSAHWCWQHGGRGQEGFAPLCVGSWSTVKDPGKAAMPKASRGPQGTADMTDGAARVS